MTIDCNFDKHDLEVKSCAPFLSVESFIKFTDELCERLNLANTPDVPIVSYASQSFNSTTYSANTDYNLTTAGGSVGSITFYENSLLLSNSGLSINIPDPGIYSITATLRAPHSAAAIQQIVFGIRSNAADFLPVVRNTGHFNGANPTNDSNARYIQVTTTRNIITTNTKLSGFMNVSASYTPGAAALAILWEITRIK